MMQQTFFCTKCRFKWKPRAERKSLPEICGNCGGKGTVRIEPDAEQILRESSEMDFRVDR